MTVTDVRNDPQSLTMTLLSEFDAGIERVWEMWSDPRRLERWWGPPTYPATFVDHDLTPGGSVSYFMTGPEGDRSHGWWRVLSVDPPHGLAFEDGFADDRGVLNADMPAMTIRVAIDEIEGTGVTAMRIETTFPSIDAMEQLLEMGMAEGMTAAIGQIDDLLRAQVNS